MERFFAAYERLLQSVNFKTYRYLYKDFNLNSRLTGLIGPRGTGKTTLLLQYIKDKIEDREIERILQAVPFCRILSIFS